MSECLRNPSLNNPPHPWQLLFLFLQFEDDYFRGRKPVSEKDSVFEDLNRP